MNETLLRNAITHTKDILTHSFHHDALRSRALVIFDREFGLTDILTSAYRANLPHAQFVDFATLTKDTAMAHFDALSPGDLVILIQSSNFRLDDFRIRLHLFKQKLHVIEHMHLYRNTEDAWDVYINALAYDTAWYHTKGHKLKSVLETASTLRISSGTHTLTVNGGLESPKLNIGDYTGMDNVGGTFPIGEVFTEARTLSSVNGSFLVYAFADRDFAVQMYTPFRVDVRDGLVVGCDDSAPENFRAVLAEVTSQERPFVREIGFGLNRAITKERFVNDITAFERILGLHLSMGEKHSVYKKEDITTHKSRYHVDLFPVVDTVYADDTLIFKNGEYLV
jgi:aminopeptidase